MTSRRNSFRRKPRGKNDDEDGSQVNLVACEMYLSEGNTFCNAGQYHRAIDSYTKALLLNPKQKTCLLNRSQCHQKVGNSAKAMADADELLKDESSQIKGLQLKADLYYQMGEFEYSLMYYHRGNKIRPEIQAFRLGIQKSEEAINNSIGDKVGVQLEKSGDLSFFLDIQKPKTKKKDAKLESQEIQEKRNLLYSSVSKRLKSTKTEDAKTVRCLLGELYRDKEYLEELLRESETVWAGSNVSGEVVDMSNECLNYLNKRTDFWQQHRPTYARTKERELQRSEAEKKSTRAWLIQSIKSLDRQIHVEDETKSPHEYDRAIESAFYLLKRMDENKRLADVVPPEMRADVRATLFSLIGDAHVKKNNFSEAMQFYEKDRDIARNWNLTDALSRSTANIGRLHSIMNNYGKAIEVFSAKLSENPSPLEKAWLNYEIGHCYFENGQSERAREYGEMALESAREADDHLWLLNTTVLLAQILAKLKEYDAAEDIFGEAHQLAVGFDNRAEKITREALRNIALQKGQRKTPSTDETEEKKEEAETSTDVLEQTEEGQTKASTDEERTD